MALHAMKLETELPKKGFAKFLPNFSGKVNIKSVLKQDSMIKMCGVKSIQIATVKIHSPIRPFDSKTPNGADLSRTEVSQEKGN